MPTTTSSERFAGLQPEEIRAELARIGNRLRNLHAGPDGELRSLTKAEQGEFDDLVAEQDAGRDLLAEHGRLAEHIRQHPRAVEGLGLPAHGLAPRDDDQERWETAEGRPINVLRPEQRMASLPAERTYDQLSFGKYLRGIVTGNWKGAEAEMRAMSEGTQSAGGYLVPTPLSDMVIDKARNAAVCIRAGAQTVPMEAATLAIARVTGDPTSAWHAEAAGITASDLSFDRVTFTAQTLAAICQLSVELVEDAANVDQVVVSTLGKVLALELDRACLRGSGTPPEPKGIRFQTGVGVDTTTFTTNGAAISGTTPTGAVAWDWLSKAIFTVRGLNEYPNACVVSERTLGELDLLRASTGEPLEAPPSVAGLGGGTSQPAADDAFPAGLFSTNAVINTVTQGSSNVASSAYIGDFSKLLIGMRRQLVLEISRTAAVGATSMFSTMQVAIRAYLRADVQLLRPAAFRVVEGIL